jgi:hypothetical protein
LNLWNSYKGDKNDRNAKEMKLKIVAWMIFYKLIDICRYLIRMSNNNVICDINNE